MNNDIFSSRLKLARKMAGLSLQNLSDKLEGKVTKQSLSKYELGLMNPSSEVLILLANALQVKPDFFLSKMRIELGEVSFRKKALLSKKVVDSIIERARYDVERYLEIEDILKDQVVFSNPLKKLKIDSREDVKMAANELRKYWNLGDNPIPNVVELLELKGVKVIFNDNIDGLDGSAAYTSEGIPIVIIDTKDKPIERIRFTVIHELAHILLNFSERIRLNENLQEKMCHFFASCLLIPSNMVIKLIGGVKRKYIEIRELISIKEYYGISLRALVHRLKEMEIITEVYYKKWMIWLSKTYGAKNEPGNYMGKEEPVRFKYLINRALSEDIISFSKAAVLANTDINKIRDEFGRVR